MDKMLGAVVGWIKSMFEAVVSFVRPGPPPPGDEKSWNFVDQVMSKHHFTPAARAWMKSRVRFRVVDFDSTRGGGLWQPARGEVLLHTAQEEAAVHELAHAWWHPRRNQLKDELIDATVRLSSEPDPQYSIMAKLAHGYVHGIPEQPWEGLLKSRNDHEMYAGFASATMGDMGKLPPYIRKFYHGLFEAA